MMYYNTAVYYIILYNITLMEKQLERYKEEDFKEYFLKGMDINAIYFIYKQAELETKNTDDYKNSQDEAHRKFLIFRLANVMLLNAAC